MQDALDGKSDTSHTDVSDDVHVTELGGSLTDVVLAFADALDNKASDSVVVHTTGDETVAGVKTFTSSPVVPTPTTNMQVATKKYVDDNAGGGGGGAGVSSLAKSGETGLTGDVTLSAGRNVTLTQAGNNIEIAASGGGGGGSSTPRFRFGSIFEHTTRFSVGTGTGSSATFGVSGMSMSAGTNVGGFAHVQVGLFVNVSGYANFDGNITFTHARRARNISSMSGFANFYGLGEIIGSTSGMSALTTAQIGWSESVVGGVTTSTYSCADGTTHNTGNYAETDSTHVYF